MKFNLRARVTAEFLGTGFLVAAVVGSGVMAERLAGGNVAIALLANTIATGAALAALILTFGPISGAHFNPAVSLADMLERGLRLGDGAAYIVAQIAGGLAGRMLTRGTVPRLQAEDLVVRRLASGQVAWGGRVGRPHACRWCCAFGSSRQARAIMRACRSRGGHLCWPRPRPSSRASP